jgi:hypothetical protein
LSLRERYRKGQTIEYCLKKWIVLSKAANTHLYDKTLLNELASLRFIEANAHVTIAGPVRAQSAIDRFTNSSYDLVVEGESYRPRMKPKRAAETEPEPASTPSRSRRGGGQNRRWRGKEPGRKILR